LSGELYKRLGVSPEATTSELRAAFRSRARALHPDGYGSADPETQDASERSMRALNEAWSVLGDADKRREYDLASEPTPQPVVQPPSAPPVDRDGGWLAPEMGPSVSLRLLAWRIVLAFVGLGLTWALFLVVLAQFVDDDSDPIADVLGGEAASITSASCVNLTVADLIVTVDCSEPNIGRAVQVVDGLRACTNPSNLRIKVPDGSGRWLCVLPLTD